LYRIVDYNSAPPPPQLKFNRRDLALLLPMRSHFRSLITARSSSVLAAPAVQSSSSRCRPVTAVSRCPPDARPWLQAALAIVMLISVCQVSTAQGTWSTAQLSVARRDIVATSVGNLAIFAGGYTGNCSFAVCEGRFVLELLCVLLYAWSCLRRSRLPSDEVNCSFWNISI
jgi:hypothetical protein